MTHSQDVNIPDKNYNLFGSAKVLPFNFVLKFSLSVQLNPS